MGIALPFAQTVLVKTIGGIARDLLQQAQSASILGHTSRGTFLSLSSGRVIFLSAEPHRGPLTLNVSGDLSSLQGIDRVHPVEATPHEISFPQAGLFIHIHPVRVWSAPPRPAGFLPPSQRHLVLDVVIRLAVSSKMKVGFSAWLPHLAHGAEGMPEDTGDSLAVRLRDLAHSLRVPQPLPIARALGAFLGYGAGLTPSGDDLVLGLLLALQRWGDVLLPALDLMPLNQSIVGQAYRQTTALSASLIDCAARGQADERLVSALDGLMTGAPDASTCAGYLAGWGSSSGLDALAGMTLALTVS
jgi:hypothetical protein